MRKLLLLVILFFCSQTWGAIAHIATTTHCSISAHSTNAANTVAVTCAPNAANDAIVFLIQCTAGGNTATAASMVASPSSGWSIYSTGDLTGDSTNGWSASFAAISPNTTSTTFTTTFTNLPNCSTYDAYIVDEFSGTDTTGGATTFYAHNKNTSTTGGCAGAAVTSTSASDAVWAACVDSLATTNWQGAGYTQGSNDANGEASEFKLATGSQTPVWASTSGAFAQLTVVIKAPGATATRHRAFVNQR